MIDFIKVKIPSLYLEHISKISFLDFYDPNSVISESGEQIEKKYSKSKSIALRAEYDYLTIDISKKGNIILYGSLHKFWSKGRNDNEFFLSHMIDALLKLEYNLGIRLDLCIIQNIEISINLYDLPLSVRLIISGIIGATLNGSKKGIQQFEKTWTSSKGNYKRCDWSQYNYKIYDKGLHIQKDNQIFRFEVQYKRNEILRNDLEINTLYDLANPECHARIINSILQKWKTIILYDFGLPDKGKHLEYRNYHFWKDIEHSKDKLFYHRQRLLKLSNTKGSNINEVISNQMIKMCDRLKDY